MSGEIKRIDYVKNMAVFHDFQWVSSVKDGGNNIAEFKKINILYGRNYSGKTTLSRIIRSLETGLISDKYDSPLFQLTFEYGIRVDQGALNTHGQVVRVFNEDFIKENLSFIFDNEKEIKSFAILGEDNARLEAEIERYESELGSGDERTGLVGKLLNAEKLFKDAHKLYDDKLSGLEEKLKDKANKTGTGIKHNKTYGDANYNVNKIKADILKVLQSSYSPPTDEQKNTLYELLRSEPKKEIKESPAFNLQYSTIASKAQVLIEKKIQVSETIQDLLGNALLSSWVRNGRELHQDKRVKCAFCGNDLPDDLWVRLNKHFNKESEDLRDAIDGLIRSIDLEKKHIANNLLKINNSEFYSNFTDDLNSLSEQFKKYSSTYCANLEAIKKQLDDRKIDIFRPQVFEKPESVIPPKKNS